MKIDAWKVAAAVKHDGTTKTMDSEAAHAAAAAAVGAQINKSYRLLAGAYKDVVEINGQVGLYGWHDLQGHPIQGFFAGHSRGWRDYSQGLRLVRRK
jgi:hypothetical protein